MVAPELTTLFESYSFIWTNSSFSIGSISANSFSSSLSRSKSSSSRYSLFFKFEVRSRSVGLFSPSSAETAESSEFLCNENTSLGCSDSPYPLAGPYFECRLLVDCCLDLTLSDSVLVLPRDDYS